MNDGSQDSGPGRRGRAHSPSGRDAHTPTAEAPAAGQPAPAAEAAARPGGGAGTTHQHLARRSDTAAAILRRAADACADAAPALVTRHEPVDALAKWLERFAGFAVTKHGLGPALRPAFPAHSLATYCRERLVPVLGSLLDTAAAAGHIRDDVDPEDLLIAVSRLTVHAQHDGLNQSLRMITVLVDGLCFGTRPRPA